MDATAASNNSPLDLHWRLFGIDFRVKPGFWLAQLFFGWFYVQIFPQAQHQLFACLGTWVMCAFFSILIHELGHVLVGRLFGARSNIVLHMLGGMAVGDFPKLARWQRIVVYAAGPAFGLALFAFANYPLPRIVDAMNPEIRTTPASWYRVVANPMPLPILEEGVGLFPPGMLVLMNLIWNVFNLLPVVPLDGGMIMKDLVGMVIPRHGERLAYGFSFLLAGGIAVYSAMKYMRPAIPFPPIDPLFNGIMFGMMAFQCFGAMQAAAPEDPQPRRYRQYEEKDW